MVEISDESLCCVNISWKESVVGKLSSHGVIYWPQMDPYYSSIPVSMMVEGKYNEQYYLLCTHLKALKV